MAAVPRFEIVDLGGVFECNWTRAVASPEHLAKILEMKNLKTSPKDIRGSGPKYEISIGMAVEEPEKPDVETLLKRIDHLAAQVEKLSRS